MMQNWDQQVKSLATNITHVEHAIGLGTNRKKLQLIQNQRYIQSLNGKIRFLHEWFTAIQEGSNSRPKTPRSIIAWAHALATKWAVLSRRRNQLLDQYLWLELLSKRVLQDQGPDRATLISDQSIAAIVKRNQDLRKLELHLTEELVSTRAINQQLAEQLSKHQTKRQNLLASDILSHRHQGEQRHMLKQLFHKMGRSLMFTGAYSPEKRSQFNKIVGDSSALLKNCARILSARPSETNVTIGHHELVKIGKKMDETLGLEDSIKNQENPNNESSIPILKPVMKNSSFHGTKDRISRN